MPAVIWSVKHIPNTALPKLIRKSTQHNHCEHQIIISEIVGTIDTTCYASAHRASIHALCLRKYKNRCHLHAPRHTKIAIIPRWGKKSTLPLKPMLKTLPQVTPLLLPCSFWLAARCHTSTVEACWVSESEWASEWEHRRSNRWGRGGTVFYAPERESSSLPVFLFRWLLVLATDDERKLPSELHLATTRLHDASLF